MSHALGSHFRTIYHMKNQIDRSLRNAKARCRSGGFVVLRLSSAKALLKRWQGEAARDVRWARKAQKTGGAQNLMLANQYAFEAKVRKEYAEELRLLLASATERQPQHNVRDLQRAGTENESKQ